MMLGSLHRVCKLCSLFASLVGGDSRRPPVARHRHLLGRKVTLVAEVLANLGDPTGLGGAEGVDVIGQVQLANGVDQERRRPGRRTCPVQSFHGDVASSREVDAICGAAMLGEAPAAFSSPKNSTRT